MVEGDFIIEGERKFDENNGICVCVFFMKWWGATFAGNSFEGGLIRNEDELYSWTW